MTVYAVVISSVPLFHFFLSSSFAVEDALSSPANGAQSTLMSKGHRITEVTKKKMKKRTTLRDSTTGASVMPLSLPNSATRKMEWGNTVMDEQYEHPTNGSSTPSTTASVSIAILPPLWCSPDLNCGDKKNLLCKHPPRSSYCDILNHYEDKQYERAVPTVLAAINTFRDRLASGQLLEGWPTAANMRQLSLDDFLAIQVAIWILTCPDGDNPCVVHPRFGHDVGQIHAKTEHWAAKDSSPVTNVHHMILEIHQTNLSIVDSYKPGKAYKNFAQLAFAEASLIGCSVIRYFQHCNKTACESLHLDGLIIEPLWCNVGPMLKAGSRLYEKGAPCTKCPQGTACRPNSTYKHLCAAPNDPTNGLYIPLPVFSNEFQDLSRSPIKSAPALALVFITTLFITVASFLLTPALHYPNMKE